MNFVVHKQRNRRNKKKKRASQDRQWHSRLCVVTWRQDWVVERNRAEDERAKDEAEDVKDGVTGGDAGSASREPVKDLVKVSASTIAIFHAFLACHMPLVESSQCNHRKLSCLILFSFSGNVCLSKVFLASVLLVEEVPSTTRRFEVGITSLVPQTCSVCHRTIL